MPAGDETLELEVTVGSTTHLMQYRIETLQWGPDVAPDARFAWLQQFIQGYDPEWTLVQIGAPGEGVVPNVPPAPYVAWPPDEDHSDSDSKPPLH
jgi:hypothetical protein